MPIFAAMQRLTSRLDKLELNLRKLLNRFRVLEEENGQLKELNANLKYKLEKANEKLELDNTNESGPVDVQWKKDVSNKLETYITELDDCIDSLKKESFG